MNFGISQTVSRQRTICTARITTWIKDNIKHYNQDDNSIEVMVTELECTDPGCVPLETLIALLGREARWTFKILKPLNEVLKLDVDAIPFKSSWSSWVLEYTIMKSNPEMHSWLSKITEEFDDKLLNFNKADQLNAVLVFRNMIQETYDSRISYIPEEMLLGNEKSVNALSAKDVSSEPEITNRSSSSTIVPMRLKLSDSITHSLAVKGKFIISDAEVKPVSQQSDFESIPIPSIPKPNTIRSDAIATVFTNEVLGVEKSNDSLSIGSRIEDKTIVSKKVKIDSSFRSNTADGLPKRHNKGTRPRGCPCCDPDNIDNIIEKMLSLEAPP